MFRNLSFVLVIGILLYSCTDEKNITTTENKFDVKSYYKSNQNNRVLNYLKEQDLLVNNQPLEIFFINHSTSNCNACLNSKYEELIEIFEKTKVNTLIVFNDSSYFRKFKNQKVKFQYCLTDELKSNKLFHSTPWFYSYSNNELVDRNLTVKVCDSLLNRFVK
jgi:hypothetical protein